MSAMEHLFAIGLGLGLRVVLDVASRHNRKLTSMLVGLWEGAVLHHFLSRTPTSWDPYVAFGFRAFVDLVVTVNLPGLAIVLMWASLTMLLADLGTKRTWYDYIARFFYRRYRRVRRAVKRIAFPVVRLPIPLPPLPKTPVPSRVRFYTITNTLTETSSTPPVPIPPPAPVPVVTSPSRRHVPGQYTDSSSSETSSVHNDQPTDTSPPEPSPPSADEQHEEETPVLIIFPSAMMTPPEHELDEIPEYDPDQTPTTHATALPAASSSSLPPPIIPPSFSVEVEHPEPTPVHVPPMHDIPEIHTLEEPDRNKELPSRPDSSAYEEPQIPFADSDPEDADYVRVEVPMPELHEIPDMERQRSESQPSRPSLHVLDRVPEEPPMLTPVDLDIPNLRNIPDLPSTSSSSHSTHTEKRFPEERYSEDGEEGYKLSFPGQRYLEDDDKMYRYPGERYPEDEEKKYYIPGQRYPRHPDSERDPGERYPEDEEEEPVASSSQRPSQFPQLPPQVYNADFDLFGDGWDNLDTRTPPPPFRERASYVDTVLPQAARPVEPIPESDPKSPTVLTTRTPSPSPLSGGSRNAIIARADLIRDQAHAEELEHDRLRQARQAALDENRPLQAFRYKCEMDQASERSKKLHERAARRYFIAHNQSRSSGTRTIDVHRLRVPEAIRETEKAIRDQLIVGGRELRVITGRGNHSVNKMPVLKMALLRHLQGMRFPARVDPVNPGVLIVSIPED